MSTQTTEPNSTTALPSGEVAAEPATTESALPDRTGIYAWVSGPCTALVLVDKRPTANAPGGQFNGTVIDSTQFYDGCKVTDWGYGRWVLLHAIDAAMARKEGGA